MTNDRAVLVTPENEDQLVQEVPLVILGRKDSQAPLVSLEFG